ncbi:MAG: type II toxin-antitoxin system RelE/ParE family toxin [Lysobacterales bacterium]
MIFVETPLFTLQIQSLVDDDGYSRFQRHLAENPEAGDLIKGTGGLRKIRMALPGRGKSGGARVIYYYLHKAAEIRLLLAYAKSSQDDLTEAQRKALKQIVASWSRL